MVVRRYENSPIMQNLQSAKDSGANGRPAPKTHDELIESLGLPVMRFSRKAAPQDESLRDPDVVYGVTSLDELVKAFDERHGAQAEALAHMRKLFNVLADKPANARAMNEQGADYEEKLFAVLEQAAAKPSALKR